MILDGGCSATGESLAPNGPATNIHLMCRGKAARLSRARHGQLSDVVGSPPRSAGWNYRTVLSVSWWRLRRAPRLVEKAKWGRNSLKEPPPASGVNVDLGRRWAGRACRGWLVFRRTSARRRPH